jgi:hypothetical protein
MRISCRLLVLPASVKGWSSELAEKEVRVTGACVPVPEVVGSPEKRRIRGESPLMRSYSWVREELQNRNEPVLIVPSGNG